MGRVAVRQAVTNYFTNQVTAGNIPYVGQVFSSRKTITQGQDYDINALGQVVVSPNGSAAVLIVHLLDDSRTRTADTGRGAVNDFNKHQITLELLFGSRKGDAVAAMDDYDQIVDAMFIAVRADATLGAPDVVWSAGEYAPIFHRQGPPYTLPNGLTVAIPSSFEFEVWEDVVGPVPR